MLAPLSNYGGGTWPPSSYAYGVKADRYTSVFFHHFYLTCNQQKRDIPRCCLYYVAIVCVLKFCQVFLFTIALFCEKWHTGKKKKQQPSIVSAMLNFLNKNW